jgi:hypothetical protein
LGLSLLAVMAFSVWVSVAGREVEAYTVEPEDKVKSLQLRVVRALGLENSSLVLRAKGDVRGALNLHNKDGTERSIAQTGLVEGARLTAIINKQADAKRQCLTRLLRGTQQTSRCHKDLLHKVDEVKKSQFENFDKVHNANSRILRTLECHDSDPDAEHDSDKEKSARQLNEEIRQCRVGKRARDTRIGKLTHLKNHMQEKKKAEAAERIARDIESRKQATKAKADAAAALLSESTAKEAHCLQQQLALRNQHLEKTAEECDAAMQTAAQQLEAPKIEKENGETTERIGQHAAAKAEADRLAAEQAAKRAESIATGRASKRRRNRGASGSAEVPFLS